MSEEFPIDDFNYSILCSGDCEHCHFLNKDGTCQLIKNRRGDEKK